MQKCVSLCVSPKALFPVIEAERKTPQGCFTSQFEPKQIWALKSSDVQVRQNIQ